VTEVVITEEYVTVREEEACGYDEIKKLLESLEYNTDFDNMTVEKVISFFEGLNEEDLYDAEAIVLSDEEITKDFDDMQKEWYFALIEVLPIIDPSSEFEPDEYIIPDIIDNPDIPSIWPTSGRITSLFGEVRTTGKHQGIDIANDIGTPVKATANGQVIAVGYAGNFGKRIMVYHGTDKNGYTYVTVYAHLSKINVKIGDSVSQGDTIGLMGNTGRSTGSHLHYEIRINGIPVDPIPYLR
jgi:murein DD-endopeptidase MepM/ murein hydrolase activator NlpD